MNNSPLRIAIISDTHGHIDHNIVAVIQNCDQVVHAGDICGAHVIEQLKSLTSNVTVVSGNNDVSVHWTTDEADAVNALPEIAELDLPGGKLVIEHGHRHGMSKPCHDSLRKSHPHARAIIYGHTHRMLVDLETDPWIINPGAAGHTRTKGGSSCLVLTASESDWDVEMKRFPE